MSRPWLNALQAVLAMLQIINVGIAGTFERSSTVIQDWIPLVQLILGAVISGGQLFLHLQGMDSTPTVAPPTGPTLSGGATFPTSPTPPASPKP